MSAVCSRVVVAAFRNQRVFSSPVVGINCGVPKCTWFGGLITWKRVRTPTSFKMSASEYSKTTGSQEAAATAEEDVGKSGGGGGGGGDQVKEDNINSATPMIVASSSGTAAAEPGYSLSGLMEGVTISSESDDEVSGGGGGGGTSANGKLSSFAALQQKNEENKRIWNEMTKHGTTKVAYPKPKVVRSRNLTDATAVFQCNAWDDVEWDEDMKKKAEEVVASHSKTTMGDDRKETLETDAHKFWDDFYGVHKNRFFRDRNWLFSEFPELESPYGGSVDPSEAVKKIEHLRRGEDYPGEMSKFKVLEVGCGAGNTVFPLLSSNNNPHTYVYCCDFSPQAVELVKSQPEYEAEYWRCAPFVLDITQENPRIPFPEGSIDVITAIFVVSAISPNKFKQVIKNFHKFLKPGGLVLFRDYGRYDLAQLRFKDGRCIEENFYVRGDGTRVYFFTEGEVNSLFEEEGFETHALLVDRRLQVNRGKQLKMYRVWVQGKFYKK